MKQAKMSGFLSAVIILCSAFLTFSAASAAVPYYTLISVPDEQNGVLTLKNGQEWYKVNRFEDNTDYIMTLADETGTQKILAVTDELSYQYIWRYYRNNMTTSTAPRISALSGGSYALSCSGGKLNPYYSYSESGDSDWVYDGSLLSWHGDTVLYLEYDAAAEEPFRFTEDRSRASAVTLYSNGDTLARCITQQPSAESYVLEGSGYLPPEFSVGIISDVTVDSLQWYADGVLQDCTDLVFTAFSLVDQPAGVHRVSCLIEAHDSSGMHYREKSAEASFVIAKGVVPDSFMTFSDIHEEYSLISDAIDAVIRKTGGYIPALVICTGDFVYGPAAEKDTELSRYFPQIVPQLGGLDAIYVAGNHDSSEAAAVMSAAASLGAEADLPAKGGLIFDGGSEAVRENGKSSRYAEGIITYGINFGAAVRENGDSVLYTYEEVAGDIERFLKETAEHYNGELIVISAHSGLHVIGMQPESVSPNHLPLYEWQGENIYNVDMSYDLAAVINRYSEQYDMDIMYIFGHDHSRGEAEMLLTDGDTLIGSRHYADRSTASQKLHFTYAHAGYLSSVIGCANYSFSFIYRDGDRFVWDLLRTADDSVRHTEIPAKYSGGLQAPAETTAVTVTEQTQTAAQTGSGTTAASALTTGTASGTSAAQTAASAQQTSAPKTGADMTVMLLTVPAAAAVLLSRKRRKDKQK